MPRYISRKPAHFQHFKDLPAELQLLIWSFCIPEPRIINYSTNYVSWGDWHCRRSNTFDIYKLTCTYPGILGACYDSRAEALKRYKPAFKVELGRHIYVDFERDTFEFGDYASLEAFSIKNTPFAGSKMEGDMIRTVGITLDDPLEEMIFTLLCSNFGGMETLMVREERDSRFDPGELSEFKGAEIEKAWPWLTGRVRRNIEARGGDWSGWRPPLVIRGTEGQWRWALRKEEVEVVEEMEWEVVREGKGKGREARQLVFE